MSIFYKGAFLLIISYLASNLAFSQTATISGKVFSELNEPIAGVNVTVPEYKLGTVTKSDGSYSIQIQTNKLIYIEFSFVGLKAVRDSVFATSSEIIIRNHILHPEVSNLTEVIVNERDRENNITRINMKSIDQFPNPSGSIESLLKTQIGVAGGNELSSQYSVRGGSFEENLIYVNDIEIYRPLLVQNAQQEGLSFVNPTMVSSIQFSAGGFRAEYGDKMASVLDIRYKKPTEFEGSAILSLLGTNLQFAGVSKNKKFTYNTGLRYKSTKYLLNSLDVKGDYFPRFGDFQSLFTYDISDKTSLSLLGNYSLNRFQMVPDVRTTKFGSIQQTLSFNVDYEGEELDKFDSYMGAITLSHNPSNKVFLKFIGSYFQTNEAITYDILSEYYIGIITKTSNNGDTSVNIGTGKSLEHARNYLEANILSLEHKGTWLMDKSILKWGLKWQFETIQDDIKEWRMIDSAGYSVPYTNANLKLDYLIASNNNLESQRIQSFIQNMWRFYSTNAEFGLTMGLRMNYWNYNNNLLVSPRASLTIKPTWDHLWLFTLSSGLYGQPPFYKELKDYTGKLYKVKPQKSIHIVAGADYHYKAWGRPFILTTEIYYKYLYDLIPYKVDNVQSIFMPEYNARGYAAGLDLRVYGEFVPGTESWFSISLLRTRENTYNDFYKTHSGKVIYPEYYRRPTDQTLNFSVFFQDYVPSFPDYKVFLMVNFGTGLPYSGPTPNRPSEIYERGQYRRVDIGFSRVIKRDKVKKVGLNNIWISFEILNLLGAENIGSYDYIRTVENNEGYSEDFAVPSMLTLRMFNFKISTKF